MKYAPIGDVFIREKTTENILGSLIAELEWHVIRNGDELCKPENFILRDGYADVLGNAQDCFSEDGETIEDELAAEECINHLIACLDDFALPYCYFGQCAGIYGFWPDHAALAELPHINDPNEIPHLDGDCVFVNDHGNITVYGSDGTLLWDCV